jgi:hypothetical protein
MEKKKFEWTDALVILMFLGGGIWLINSSFNVDQKDGVKPWKALHDNGIEIDAVYDDSARYEETQYSDHTTRRYFTKYFFRANNKLYEGEVESDTLSNYEYVRIKYLPEDPSVNSAHPIVALENARSDAKYGWKFWLGLFLCLCGGASLWELISPKKEAPKERVEL